MSVTLQDIASRLGVSVSTVSLVVNGRDKGRVGIPMAERIRATAEELGYLPNLSARGLKTRQTRTLGLLSHGVASVPFAGQMLAGAQVAAWERGFVLLLIDTAEDLDLTGPAVKALVQRNIQALILAVGHHQEVHAPVMPNGIPTVLLNGRPDAEGSSTDWVVPDESAGAETAVRDLLQAGHRRIAL